LFPDEVDGFIDPLDGRFSLKMRIAKVFAFPTGLAMAFDII